jgi:hypothetical protein
VPDVLKNLTFAEEALIARIQVAAAAKKLKFGDRSLSGHVSFFDRTANVTEVATVLPNLADNLQILEFTKQVGRAANHTFRDFRVRRHAVQAALLWLCTHSPAYIGITVDQARIDALPVDGQIQVQVVEVQDDPEDVDLGPAAAQRDPADLDHTGAPPAGSLGVRQDARQVGSIVEVISDGDGTLRPARITNIEGNANADALVAVEYLDDIGGLEAGIPLARITIEVEADHTGIIDAPHTTTEAATASLAGLAAAAQAPNAGAAAGAAAAAATAATAAATATAQSTPQIVHRHVSEFLRWEDMPFFFAKAFPTLFMPDRLNDPAHAQVPAEFKPVNWTREANFTFSEWSKYLIHSTGRFAAHPTFMFSLHSIKQRQQARSCISFAVNGLPDSAPPRPCGRSRSAS